MTYQPRTYREHMQAEGLVSFNVVVQETDLHIHATMDLQAKALRAVLKYRHQLSQYIMQRPEFLKSLIPIEQDANAPDIVREMIAATTRFGVGPMASVAGAVAQFVGKELLNDTPEIIIENGGDLFLKTTKSRRIKVYPGNTELADKLVLEVTPQEDYFAICTSAGKLGHSLSFGQADAVVVRADDTLVADAAATALGNRVQSADDIESVLTYAKGFPMLKGVLIVAYGYLGIQGNIKFAEV